MSSEDSLIVRTLSSLDEVPCASWDALLGPEDSPFVRYDWLKSLQDAGCVEGKTGWTSRHVTVWRGERLVAAAPAYIKEHSEGEFVFDFLWADAASQLGLAYYPKLVVAVPFTPSTGGRLLIHPAERRDLFAPVLSGAIRAVADKLELSSVHVLFPSERDRQVLQTAGFETRFGVQFHWHNEGFASYEDYLATFNSKRRHQLRRERRVVQEAGIQLRTLRGSDIGSAELDAMTRFYLLTVKRFRPWSRKYLNRRFFQLVHERMPGALELVFAYREGAPIAGAFNILGANDTLYGRYWGASEEHPFLHFNVCYYHSIEECITRGLRCFEPGAGGQHKIPRGFRPTLTTSSHWIAHPQLRRMIHRFLKAERDAISQQLTAQNSDDSQGD